MPKGYTGSYLEHIKQKGIKLAERRKKERIARKVKLMEKNSCDLLQEQTKITKK
jgi:hypothetical protein